MTSGTADPPSSHSSGAAAVERSPHPRRVFLTGATGYIGGRLAPRLLAKGHSLVCLVRDPRKLDARPWVRGGHESPDDGSVDAPDGARSAEPPTVDVVQADVSDEAALTDAMRGCDVAYYLIHSMISAGDEYVERDRELARTFARAAATAGIERIVYLGGLGEMGPGLSEHLRSRREVERVLDEGEVPVTTFRAAMIIGSGSASFEILRYLTERLPIMITPKWVRTECQPVGIADVLHWLVRCLDVDATTGCTLEIGGPDVRSYRELMQETARQLGLRKRVIIPVPVLTPTLSSLWIGLVTPVSSRIGRPLAEGLRNRVVVTDDLTQRLMPHDALSSSESIARALQRTADQQVETRWSAAGVVPGDPDWAGGTVLEDRREITIDASPAEVYAAVCRVGGGHGWYAADILWRLRGWMDQLAGGPGLRRGRRHPELVEYGEALDFWRVVDVERDRRLGLLAEMKLPGEARLDFEVDPVANDPDTREHTRADDSAVRTRLVMTARFRPRGLLGLLYWYAVLPLHHVVFGGMLNGMRRAAEAMTRGTIEPPSGSAGDSPGDRG